MALQAEPIIVDLDGTLIKTDLLFESANQFLASKPLAFGRLIFWLFKGRPYLKAQLAKHFSLDPALLPYNQALLTWLGERAKLGVTIYLATASNHSLADSVAKHLGIFTGVFASNEEMNLKSERKRDLLVQQFGEQGFDYIGNESADVVVWLSAKRAHVVSTSKALIAKAASHGNLGEVFAAEKPGGASALLKEMRVYQWVKNCLIFVPLLAAHQLANPLGWAQAFIAFLAFCFCASAVYLLNDLVDISNDRLHPRKRFRPFAAGHLSLLTGWVLWPILLLLAFVFAFLFLPSAFTFVLAAYFFITVAYSFALKRYAILDVLVLAGLYTIRILAGAVAVSVPVSFWLLTFSMFLFLSLAFVKRFSELKTAQEQGNGGKLAGRGYAPDDLEIVSMMGVAAGYLSILVLAFYIQDSYTAVLYRTPQIIWLACPLLLYWVSRTWVITHRGNMTDDPIIFAIKDRTSWIVAVCFALIFILASL